MVYLRSISLNVREGAYPFNLLRKAQNRSEAGIRQQGGRPHSRRHPPRSFVSVPPASLHAR